MRHLDNTVTALLLAGAACFAAMGCAASSDEARAEDQEAIVEEPDAPQAWQAESLTPQGVGEMAKKLPSVGQAGIPSSEFAKKAPQSSEFAKKAPQMAPTEYAPAAPQSSEFAKKAPQTAPTEYAPAAPQSSEFAKKAPQTSPVGPPQSSEFAKKLPLSQSGIGSTGGGY